MDFTKTMRKERERLTRTTNLKGLLWTQVIFSSLQSTRCHIIYICISYMTVDGTAPLLY